MKPKNTINFLIDESASMRGAEIESARQIAMQILREANSRDLRNQERTSCNFWSFSDEPCLIGLNISPGDLFALPLKCRGGSMLGLALKEVLTTCEETINQLRTSGKLKKNQTLSLSKIIISDMKPSDSWLEIANQLAKLGKLSLIKTNGKPSDSFNSKEINLVFQGIYNGQNLSHPDITKILNNND